jgi:hypothetical protein
VVVSNTSTLATGAFLGAVLLSKAETSDIFTRHGLPVPGVYFKNKENQKATTAAVSKSGKGIGGQKQTESTIEQEHRSH